MLEIFVHEHPPVAAQRETPSIFLAGLSPRKSSDYDWRPDAIECLKNCGFNGIVYIPIPRNGQWFATYEAQLVWEFLYLKDARVVLFWMPHEISSHSGFTTIVEFGKCIGERKQMVLGYPLGAFKVRYMHHLADMYRVPVHHTLQETVGAALQMLS